MYLNMRTMHLMHTLPSIMPESIADHSDELLREKLSILVGCSKVDTFKQYAAQVGVESTLELEG